MKRYIGTKTVHATPMNRADYNTYRGWELPSNENGADEGYLVEYTDGGTGNDSRHVGYISWSPKAQFETAYSERRAHAELQPYQQRVLDERAELDEKAVKLEIFLQSPAFDALNDYEQALLGRQFLTMRKYSAILAERISRY